MTRQVIRCRRREFHRFQNGFVEVRRYEPGLPPTSLRRVVEGGPIPRQEVVLRVFGVPGPQGPVREMLVVQSEVRMSLIVADKVAKIEIHLGILVQRHDVRNVAERADIACDGLRGMSRAGDS